MYSKRIRDNAVNDLWLAHNMSHSLQGGYIHSHVTDHPAPVIKLMHLADEAGAQIEIRVIQELTDHA